MYIKGGGDVVNNDRDNCEILKAEWDKAVVRVVEPNLNHTVMSIYILYILNL